MLKFRQNLKHCAMPFPCRLPALIIPRWPSCSNHNTHGDGVLVNLILNDSTTVRLTKNCRAQDVLSFVDGVITKSASQTELATGMAIRMQDNGWYLIPFRRHDVQSLEGCGVGSFVPVVPVLANAYFAFLTKESERVYLRCRDDNNFYHVRGIGLYALKTLGQGALLASNNSPNNPALKGVLTASVCVQSRQPEVAPFQHGVAVADGLSVSDQTYEERVAIFRKGRLAREAEKKIADDRDKLDQQRRDNEFF